MDDKFVILQNVSLRLLVQPSDENVALFSSLIKKLDDEAIVEFQACLLVPTLSLLRKRTALPQRVRETAIQILEDILARSTLKQWTTFRDVIGCICITTSDYVASIPQNTIIDEYVVAMLMGTACTAFRSIDLQMLTTALKEPDVRSAFSVLWSNVVFLGVDFIRKSTSRTVRLKCLDLIYSTMLEKVGDFDTRYFLGATFANFLPGIMTACLSLIQNTNSVPSVGHGVMVQSIDTLSSVLSLVYSDSQIDVAGKMVNNPSHAHPLIDHSLRETRTDLWMKETVPRISVALKSLLLLPSDESVHIRLAVVMFIRQIVSTSLRTLKDCLPVLIRMLLPLAEDSFERVSTSATDVLQLIRLTVAADWDSLWGVLQEDFVLAMESLPEQANRQSETTFVLQMKLCIGYCKLLSGDRLSILLMSGDIMHRLTNLLVDLADLDYSNVDLMEYKTDGNEDFLGKYRNMSKETLPLFHKLCHCLSSSNFPRWLQHLSMVLTEPCDSSTLNSRLFVATAIVSGYRESSCEGDQRRLFNSTTFSLLQIYVVSDIWNLSTSVQSTVLSKKYLMNSELTFLEDNSKVSYKHRVVGICLLLHGISALLEVIGSDSKRHIHSVLYLILEKTVSQVQLIQNRAHSCLSVLAKLYGHSSVSAFIEDNINLLVSSVVIKIRQLHRNPSTVFVLQSILNLTSVDVLPNIWKIVTFLLDKLDDFHDEAALPFLVVLGTVIHRVSEWQQSVPTSVGSAQTGDRVDEGVRYLVEGQGQEPSECNVKKISASGLEEEKASDFGHPDEADDEPVLPQHVGYTVDILQRCAYLLPTNDRNLRSVILDIVRDGCLVLQSYQKQLLPIIHKVWTSIIILHRSLDLVMFRKAFLCLVEMTSVAGSFLRYRVSSDIVPLIARFLGQEAKRSAVAGSTPDQWNPTRRLQITLLNEVPVLLKNIDAEDSAYQILSSSVLPYLLTGIAEQLRDHAISFFCELTGSHPDIVSLQILQASDVVDDFSRPGLPPVTVRHGAGELVPRPVAERILEHIPAFDRRSQK